MANDKIKDSPPEDRPGLTGYSFEVHNFDNDGLLNSITTTGTREDFKRKEATYIPRTNDLLPDGERIVEEVIEMDEEQQPMEEFLCYITAPVFPVRVCTEANYRRFLNDEYVNPRRGALVNAVIYRERTREIDLYNADEVLDDRILYGELPPFDMIDPTDYFTGFNLSDLVRGRGIRVNGLGVNTESKDVKDKKYSNLTLTPEMILLLRKNPKLYKKKYIDKQPVNLEYNRETSLITTLLLQPGEMDERYVVVESKPKSFKMKTYLEALAGLVLTEIEKSDEIDDLEGLKERAYKKAGFKEPFELINEAAAEFEDYFKYLLTKDEKTVITSKELETIKEIVEEIKESSYYRGISKNKERIREKIIDYSDKLPFNLECSPDIVYKSPFGKNITCFKIVKINQDMSDFQHLISKLNLDIETAITDSCLRKKYGYDISKKFEIVHNFLVIDKTGNIFKFGVKSETLKKWNKKLEEELEKISWHINNVNYNLPWEFHNISMSI